MTFTIAGPTEAELATWIRTNIDLLWSLEAADTILAKYDFAEKGTPSRNSRNKVSMALIAHGPDDPPFSPATPEKAARALAEQFVITYKPVTAVVDLPMPIVVSRHQCPFCRRYTRANQDAVTKHMRSCWHNPGLRCCKTCAHHQHSVPPTVDGDPGWDECCTHTDGPETGYSFPVLNCPLWQPKGA